MATSDEFPTSVTLLPGQLDMIVHLRALGPTRCWVFVSQGLATLGHRELVLAVELEPGEDPQRIPTQIVGSYFASVHAFARQGQFVNEWDWSSFDQAILWGRSNVVYAPPLNLGGVEGELPADALAAIVLHDDEFAVACRFGPSRVLARLGLATRFYPWPPMLQRNREPLALGPEVWGRVLGRMTSVWLRDGHALREPGRIDVWLPRRSLGLVERLLQHLQPPGFAITLGIAPDADSCMVFAGAAPGAIGMVGSQCRRVALTMMVVLLGRERDECSFVEDGFGLALTNERWLGLRAALERGEYWSLRHGDMHVELNWHDDPAPARRELWSCTKPVEPPQHVTLLAGHVEDKDVIHREMAMGIAALVLQCLEEHYAAHPLAATQLWIDVRLDVDAMRLTIEGDAGEHAETLLAALHALPRTQVPKPAGMRLHFEIRASTD